MDERIVKLAKKILNISLISSKDLGSLGIILNKIKKKNFSKKLNGFKPDLKSSVTNIANFIESAFDSCDEIVVFAVDAISYEYYYSEIQKVSRSHDHRVGVLSSVFPSTTSVVWPSIITGTLPSEHGIYGTSFLHEVFLKNYIWISNTINHKNERRILNEESLRLNLSDKKTLFERLKEKGVISYYLGTHGQGDSNPFRNELIKGSVHIKPGKQYPKLKHAPQKLISYFIGTNKKILRKKEGKRLIWNYVDLDDFIHENGYSNLSKSLDWGTLFDFWKRNRKNRLFLLISDHGQISQEPSVFDVLKTSAEDSNLKYNSGGAGRVIYFYPEIGKENETLDWVKNIVGNNGLVIKKDDLVKLGLVQKKAVGFERIGSIVAIATTREFPSVGNRYVAEHGSLSSEEMFVPFVIQVPK